MEELYDDSLIISPLPELEEQKSDMESDSEESNEWFEQQLHQHFQRQNTPCFDEIDKHEITITDKVFVEAESHPSGEFIGTLSYLFII